MKTIVYADFNLCFTYEEDDGLPCFEAHTRLYTLFKYSLFSFLLAVVGLVTNDQIFNLHRFANRPNSVFSFMASIKFDHYPQFFTATILEWKHLLKRDEFKQIVIESLSFLKNEGSVEINAFVIMPNHLHLIWQIQNNYKQDKIQMRFLKYTAQQMKFKLMDTADKMLDGFMVNAADRQYQIWERNSLSIDLWSEKVFIQKLIYIHNNLPAGRQVQ